MDAINWSWVLILLVLVCPISMLLMRRGHRHKHDGRPTNGGISHEHTERGRANVAELDTTPGAVGPRSELQRRQEALARETETLKGERFASDGDQKH